MNRDQVENDIARAINELMAERQQLLISFCRMAGLDAGVKAAVHSDQPVELRELCQILMDYYALWQFEIHDLLLSSGTWYPDALEALKQAAGRLEESRIIAVAFNDKYDSEGHALQMDRLEHDLSLLGEEIAQQIGLEDRIIHAMKVR